MALEGPLLFALNAISLAFIFFSHIEPPFRPLANPREPPAASVRTRTRYPRATLSGGISRLVMRVDQQIFGDMGEMSD